MLIAISVLSATTISSISINGNKRTDEMTLLKIANLSLGDTISDSLIESTTQRILRTDIFTSCDVTELQPGEITISVVEKWTIIPFVSFQGNGGKIILFNTGLYDANFLGRAGVIGGDYTYLLGTHSGQIFAMKDNIGDKRVKLTGRLRTQKGLSNWYDSTGCLEAGFLVDRKLVFASGELPLNEKLTVSISGNLLYDTLSESISTVNFDSLNSANGYHFEGSNRAFVPTLSARYSNFKYKTFTYSGGGIKAGVGHAFESDFGGYNSFSLAGQWYKELPLKSNLCFNGELFGADGHAQTNVFYLGGMSGVRGFPENLFRGKALGKLNIEYRIPSLNTKWLVFQHVLFADYATIAPRLTDLDHSVSVGSGGVGLRILSPKIYSFMIRLDYGWGFTPLNSRGLSFGTTHYFRPF